jgi:acyl-CoA thioester hydrolase
MRDSGYAWPVIDMRIRYAGMARYGQKLKVEAELVEWENRLRFQYVVRDAKSGKRLTKAETTQVAIDWKSGEMLFRSPDVLFHKLGIPVP